MASTVAGNFLLIVGSLLVAALLAEIVVFRFLLLPSDVPRNAFVDGIVKYAPSQQGVYRAKGEIEAPFAINEQGWNSGHAAYRQMKSPDRTPESL